MLHALRILRFVWKARRPSTLHDMPVVVDAFWIRKGYQALTFFGVILTHTHREAALLGGRLNTLKNHELIHLKQAVATNDSWWRFYALYLRFWWKARKAHYPNAGYRLNPFEMEAYEHMNDLDYPRRHQTGANDWRRFAAMTIEERIHYLQQPTKTANT